MAENNLHTESSKFNEIGINEENLFFKFKENQKQMLDNLAIEDEQNYVDLAMKPRKKSSTKNKNTTCRLSQSDLIFSKNIMKNLGK